MGAYSRLGTYSRLGAYSNIYGSTLSQDMRYVIISCSAGCHSCIEGWPKN